MRKKRDKMRIKLVILVAAPIMVVLPAAFGQHGIARNNQNGSLHDIWLGTVVSTNDATREITIISNKGFSESFTGVLKDHLSEKTKDGSKKELRPSDFPRGTKITVFYEQKKVKASSGEMKVYNEIFRIERPTNIR
jgi:hypothetical protein